MAGISLNFVWGNDLIVSGFPFIGESVTVFYSHIVRRIEIQKVSLLKSIGDSALYSVLFL